MISLSVTPFSFDGAAQGNGPPRRFPPEVRHAVPPTCEPVATWLPGVEATLASPAMGSAAAPSDGPAAVGGPVRPRLRALRLVAASVQRAPHPAAETAMSPAITSRRWPTNGLRRSGSCRLVSCSSVPSRGPACLDSPVSDAPGIVHAGFLSQSAVGATRWTRLRPRMSPHGGG